jgi:hypothetical protein
MDGWLDGWLDVWMDVQVEVEATRRRTDLVVAAEVMRYAMHGRNSLSLFRNRIVDTFSWGQETYS